LEKKFGSIGATKEGARVIRIGIRGYSYYGRGLSLINFLPLETPGKI